MLQIELSGLLEITRQRLKTNSMACLAWEHTNWLMMELSCVVVIKGFLLILKYIICDKRNYSQFTFFL